MKNRIDNILLGILWLLAATLATSFWLNTRYGFNMFSAPHWQYLAYLQASHTPVNPMFYISLGVAAFITISGMYMLLQPHFRHIAFPIKKVKSTTPPHPAQQPETTVPQPTPAPTQTPALQQQSTASIPPAQPTTTASAPTPITSSTPQPVQPSSSPVPVAQPIPVVPLRPPRLNLPTTNSYTPAPTPAPTQPAKHTQSHESPELREIFTTAGYVVKNPPFISGFKPSLLAIGTNEALWLGAINTDTKTLQTAIDKLNEVFTDTLEDIYIDITGFVINATDAQAPQSDDILLFDNLTEVSQYITEHTNPQPTPDEVENFDAYSEYIDTVIGYIGKL